MSECADQWIEAILGLSGATEVTTEVLEGAIKAIEDSLLIVEDEDDVEALNELRGILHDSE